MAQNRVIHDHDHLTDASQYTSPRKLCDMVMKGGVTSGIVYPLAVCELARTYTFKSIGGASAGAIAAAATAAAELGRHSEHGGFARMAQMPGELGKHGALFSLFQPQPATRRLFGLITAPLGPARWRAARILAAALRNFPLAMLAGAFPGLLLALAIAALGGWRFAVGALLALFLIAIGAASAVIIAALFLAFRALPANFYGLCSGFYGEHPGKERPLTVWLTEILDQLAGRADAAKPLTFEDLWGTRDPAASRKINLEVVSTCLTHGRPYTIPFDTKGFWLFDPREFRRLFPEHVVAWMEQHPREIRNPEKFTPLGLVPLPEPADMPVVVATRMSLSFPFLISAVPLYAIDSSRKREDDRVPELCWFSDGGITSNLPVHIFDAPLPRWPTFAINLRSFHPDYCRDVDEEKNSFLALTNRAGMRAWWYRLDSDPCSTDGRRVPPRWLLRLRERLWPSSARLRRFIHAIQDTMQNWRDNMQLFQPGYRDRVVHISLAPDEGGTNLKMDESITAALSERGRYAGVKLRDRFAGDPGAAATEGWDNHRWVRYRSTMAVLERMLRNLHTGYCQPIAGEQSYAEMIGRSYKTPPSSYRWNPVAQRVFATRATAGLIRVIEEWNDQPERFSRNAPQPEPELRIMPRM